MPGPAEKTDADRRTSPTGDPVECVMICAGGAARAPEELVRTLKSRGAALAIVSDVFAAAALVTQSHTGQAVVIVDPDRVPRADELATALRTRAPGVVCWRFCATERPQLRGYFSPAHSHDSQSNADTENERTIATPNRNGAESRDHDQAESLRFRDGLLDVEIPREDENFGSPAQHTDDAPPARASLTSEELAMLLRDDLEAPDQEGV